MLDWGMLRIGALIAALTLPLPAVACDAPVCLVDPDTLALDRVITFDDLPSSRAVGTQINAVLVQPGAAIGERFAGQTRTARGDFDRIEGRAVSPLTVIDGGARETLGIMRLSGTNVLIGYGPRRYPADEAVGEGAIAVLFDQDQSAFGFELRGGEAGFAELSLLRRSGEVIHLLRLGPLGETAYAFARRDGQADIAGFLIVNTDPEGVALDNLRFLRHRPVG